MPSSFGDDDVYLFINGKLVMDLGGGHSISKAKITLNDVKTICGLKDGQVYDFDFCRRAVPCDHGEQGWPTCIRYPSSP